MIENYNKYKILKNFFDKPAKKFQLRELSRNSDISLPSVKNYVEELLAEDLIEKVEEGVYPGYKASKTDKFCLYKKIDLERRLHDIGLVDFLKDKLSAPDAIVLFGSAARGEDIERSDLDILVVSGEKGIDLKKFEEEINREINLLFMSEKELKEDKELANNIANGILLDGYLVVK